MRVGQNEEMVRFQEVSSLDGTEYNAKAKQAKKKNTHTKNPTTKNPVIIITLFLSITKKRWNKNDQDTLVR